MMKPFEQIYPYIAAWVQDGIVEIGYNGYDRSFMRVFDEGGMLWEGGQGFANFDEALTAMDQAIAEWCRIHMPDIDIGSSQGYSFTPEEGQFLAFIYNYTVLYGFSPAEIALQQFFGMSPTAVHQMLTKLEQEGLLVQQLGKPQSVQVAIPARFLPTLEPIN